MREIFGQPALEAQLPAYLEKASAAEVKRDAGRRVVEAATARLKTAEAALERGGTGDGPSRGSR